MDFGRTEIAFCEHGNIYMNMNMNMKVHHIQCEEGCRWQRLKIAIHFEKWPHFLRLYVCMKRECMSMTCFIAILSPDPTKNQNK